MESLIINHDNNIKKFSWLQFKKPEMTKQSGKEIILLETKNGLNIGLTALVEGVDIEECKIKIYFLYCMLIDFWKLIEDWKKSSDNSFNFNEYNDLTTWHKQALKNYCSTVSFMWGQDGFIETNFSADCDDIEFVASPFSITIQRKKPDSLADLINILELNAHEKDGRYILLTGTENYTDQDGEQVLLIVISQDVEAEVITINCPR
ncbi:hypothetical protein IQ225_19300, partial [Synechocystis salina LEGE 06155]|nr:hypothetical protein [Synechocystis salina LEGE 06155]